MRSLFTLRPIRSRAVLVVIATGLTGYAGGCGTRDVSQGPVNNEEIPKAWQVTKQGMRDRMKQMRKQGGPRRGTNSP